MDNLEIQRLLNVAGYGPLTVDGNIGAKSLDAIKRFQRANNLMPDGVIGPRTAAKLQLHSGKLPATSDAPGGNVFSAAGMKMLGASEGIRTKAYYDTAKPPVLTIGMGATWGSGVFREWWAANRPGEKFTINSVLRHDEITEVTRRMIDQEYGAAVNEMLDNVKIPQHAFDAAVHFIYNVGTGGTSWRWATPFKAGDYCGAAEIVKTYLKPKDLLGRRLKEAALMCKGIYHA